MTRKLRSADTLPVDHQGHPSTEVARASTTFLYPLNIHRVTLCIGSFHQVRFALRNFDAFPIWPWSPKWVSGGRGVVNTFDVLTSSRYVFSRENWIFVRKIIPPLQKPLLSFPIMLGLGIPRSHGYDVGCYGCESQSESVASLVSRSYLCVASLGKH